MLGIAGILAGSLSIPVGATQRTVGRRASRTTAPAQRNPEPLGGLPTPEKTTMNDEQLYFQIVSESVEMLRHEPAEIVIEKLARKIVQIEAGLRELQQSARELQQSAEIALRKTDDDSR